VLLILKNLLLSGVQVIHPYGQIQKLMQYKALIVYNGNLGLHHESLFGLYIQYFSRERIV